RPSLRVELAVEANGDQLSALLPALAAHGEAEAALLKELHKAPEPTWSDPPLDPAWASPEAALGDELRSANGVLAERFALCQTLPLDRLDHVVGRLARAGYRLGCCRPYSAGSRLQVAALWARDGLAAAMVHGARADELRRQDASW